MAMVVNTLSTVNREGKLEPWSTAITFIAVSVLMCT